ncbi:MAG: hypothetical protein NC548_61350 [Lachnospiraceae bacterium]|nr:hypothetical protein [Lachnospiraceae bacterium]
MQEEFVNYQQAVKLKECGFDWECNRYYSKEDAAEGTVWEYPNPTYENFNDGSFGSNSVSAPTQALAQKWLRDIHKISIEPICNTVAQWNVNVCTIGVCGEILWAKIGLDSYESALSAGLDAALELIKQK